MKIAILSGKGGTGKTFIAVNLAVSASEAVYVDCDVEAPNGSLFLQPEALREETVVTRVPVFDEEKCTGCRACVNFCRFGALVFVKDKPLVFPEICHACGGCLLVCPSGAVSERDKPVGTVEQGRRDGVCVVTGCMKVGEPSGVPVIKAALSHVGGTEELTVIDCPPGSACTVMESVEIADYCLLVAEPTAFGLHNIRMVFELVSLLEKPCGVIINKLDDTYAPLEDFCESHKIPVLCRIPYSSKLADLCAKGKIAVLEDEDTKKIFLDLLDQVRREAGR
jgi:MinD superfamily P-loop ATPase